MKNPVKEGQLEIIEVMRDKLHSHLRYKRKVGRFAFHFLFIIVNFVIGG